MPEANLLKPLLQQFLFGGGGTWGCTVRPEERFVGNALPYSNEDVSRSPLWLWGRGWAQHRVETVGGGSEEGGPWETDTDVR